MAPVPDQALHVRQFWFAQLPQSAAALAPRLAHWLGTAESADHRQRDEALRTRFEPLVVQALAGELEGWAGSPRRSLSLILLLDPFPRILYRGTARAFAGNARALALALSGIQSGADAALEVLERVFFYMPLQHAESLEAQQESLAVHRRLLQETAAELRPVLAGVLRSVEARHALIARFGRFPERNAILGRDSTLEEQEFLAAGDAER
jgi:uncharacterized protein (DUF924 family)